MEHRLEIIWRRLSKDNKKKERKEANIGLKLLNFVSSNVLFENI